MYSILKSNTETVSQAIAFLKRSALHDEVSAQTALGREYHAGENIPCDPELAEYWYRKAIRNGATMAPYYLSKLLTETRTDRNGLVEAYKLLIAVKERTNPADEERVHVINEQEAIILKKASNLGYGNKSLVRQAESMAANEETIFFEKDLSDLYFRCRELAIYRRSAP
jgi:TPR repeat protein